MASLFFFCVLVAKRKGIKQAQTEGIVEAKKRGKHLGRPRITEHSYTRAKGDDNTMGRIGYNPQPDLLKTSIAEGMRSYVLKTNH